ncbi:MAG: glycosyltransferase [Chitinophagaceae bacterium]|nr:glycosyltransferase [Oligoflexus sp.]
MTRFLTTIIPTYNRAQGLRKLVPWLRAQAIDRDASEIIIVNDGSVDDTEAYLESIQDEWIRVISQENQGQAKARSVGVESARGDILLFLDDDMEPATPDFFNAHLNFHQKTSRATVALGAILPPPSENKRPAFELFYERSIEQMTESFRNGSVKPSGMHFFSANVSLPKELYLRSGGFSIEFRQAEDRELGLRLEHEYGALFAFVESAAAIHHSGTRHFSGFLNRAYQYGRYDLKIAKSFPEHDELSPYQIFAKPPLSKMFIAKSAWRAPSLLKLFNGPLVQMAKLCHAFGWNGLAIRVCSILYCINFVLGLKDEHYYDI